MKVGDVVLFDWSDFKHPIKNFFHNFISVYNKIKYKESACTHAGIISSIRGENVYIHEAIGKKDSKDFKAYEYTKNWLNVKISEGRIIIKHPTGVTRIREHCGNYEQSFYDWISIILMPFKLAINSTKLVFCSEVVARILYDASNKKLNISSELGKSYEKITPMDLYLSEQLE